MIGALINISYLIGAVAFVWGLRLLSSPDSARRGNILAAFGMGLAIVVTLVQPMTNDGQNNYAWIIGGMLGGAIIGWFAAKKIKMTAMPQMVSIFNGLGGACAAVLAMIEFSNYYGGFTSMDVGQKSIAGFALMVGAISFSGSMLAFGKLEDLVDDSKVTFKGHNILNIILLLASLALGVYVIINGISIGVVFAIVFLAVALVYGFSFVAPIGGADMPVVISLLNSLTGLSAAAAGLIYDNQLMLVGGILVGAAGIILTILMCEAMNRSLLNVIVGGFGGGASAKGQDGDQVAKEINLSDASILLYYSQSVVFVPGYGLAVAQAQKAVKELDELLEKNGVEVKYAIHPVAGRMPGHMNVLLAEADVPYPKLLDLEDANNAISNSDVVVVVGANDVVNPAALDDPGSPIYGMPVLNVWEAKHVIVMKRSMRPGYAGIQNPLFFHERTKMLFGDAKDSMQNLSAEVKTL